MPEVAIFDGPEPNAFATGAFKNNALVAVSTGLLQGMSQDEVEAVIGHEVAHIANGDMVTMTLIQGVLNTFVMFLSRVVGYLVDSCLRRGERRRRAWASATMVTVFVLRHRARHSRRDHRRLVLAPARVPRRRRRRAPAGPQAPMISALARLGGMEPGELPQQMRRSASPVGRRQAVPTHPPIEERIAALQAAA